MTRPFCLGLVLALASHVPIHAQPKDPPKNFTNSIGMKFVWIAPGTFLMGSPKEDENREDNESQHKVTLTKGFYMGIDFVTQEQWQEVMGNNPSHFKGEKNLPVETVSWDDCQDFCKKLREKDKKPYRLPGEAEWEFACRAGTNTQFHFGDTISTDQANYADSLYALFPNLRRYHGLPVNGNREKEVFRGKTTPVGSFPANAWGLHDMHGNLWQWCQDWYGDYPQKAVVDPQGPNAGEFRVLRGGSWSLGLDDCRSAFRGKSEPGYSTYYVGFRVCYFLE